MAEGKQRYVVNPEIGTRKVTIATGQKDEDGNLKYADFAAGVEHELEKKYADATDYDGTPYFVEAKKAN